MYEGIAEPGMGTYPPRARLDRGVFQRGNSRRARLAPSLAEGGGSPRPVRFGLEKHWDERHLPITLYVPGVHKIVIFQYVRYHIPGIYK